VHPLVAEHLARATSGPVLDLGGGTGHLAGLLAARSIPTVVVDNASHLSGSVGSAVRADARHLPFPDATFPAAAALWMLYHLADPHEALGELHRVLRPGSLLGVCASSRTNDPELAHVLPGWGRQSSFDAEDAAEIVGRTFHVVDVMRWDAPLVHLPDRTAIELFLRGRGLSETDAHHEAGKLPAPLEVTKRGALVWSRRL